MPTGVADKKRFWVTAGMAAVLAILFALFLLLPKAFHLDPVREKVQSYASQVVGGPVSFKQVELSFFPRPHLMVESASVSLADKLTGGAESIVVFPKLIPLILGRIELAKLEIESPAVRMSLPERTDREENKGEGFPWALIRERILNGAPVPVAKVLLENGRLELLEGDKTLFQFQQVNATIAPQGKSLQLNMTCTSNLWERLSVDGWVDLTGLGMRGQVIIDQFQPQPLAEYIVPFSEYRIGDSPGDLKIDFKMSETMAMHAEIESSIPHLILHRGTETVIAKDGTIKGSLHVDKGKTKVSLSELHLGSPQLNMTGELSWEQSEKSDSPVHLALQGRDLDIASIREAALKLGKQYDTTGGIFNIVKGGNIPVITVEAKAHRFSDLWDSENLVITGRLEQGRVFVPGADLNLDKVVAEVKIEHGILNGENIEASHGDTHGRHGRLQLGLYEANDPFHLDIMVETGLKKLPPLLNRWIDDRSFRNQLALIDNLEGKAKGRLTLGDSTASLQAQVDVSDFDLQMRHRRIPYVVTVKGGQFFYDEDGIRVKDIESRMGKSFVSGLSGFLHWDKDPRFECRSGQSEISFGELLPWLASLERLRPYLSSDKQPLAGEVTVSALGFEGVWSKPETWRVDASGRVKQLRIHTDFLPVPMDVTGGKFQVVESANKHKLFIENSQVAMWDAVITVSGVLDDYLTGVKKGDLTFQGDMGSQSLQWAARHFHLSSEYYGLAALSISDARLIWEENDDTRFVGTLDVVKGPQVSLDVKHNPERLLIRKLLIQDSVSNASLYLDLTKRALNLNFDGHLAKQTVGSLLKKEQLLPGKIEGNFQVNILIDEPAKSTVQGTLVVEDFLLPWIEKPQVLLDSIYLQADGDDIELEMAHIKWGEQQLGLNGHIVILEKGWQVDADLAADTFHWEKAREALDGFTSTKDKDMANENPWRNLPVTGTIRFQCKKFTYGDFSWTPFRGEIALANKKVTVSMKEAVLCGISTPGTVDIFPHEIRLQLRPVSQDEDLAKALACIGYGKDIMTGTFDFEMEASAQGIKDHLARSLNGPIRFQAKNGRIYRYGLLGKIVAFLNVTEIFRGKLPDLTQEGFGYDSITVKGHIKKGRLWLEEFVLDGVSMEIVCEGTVDLLDKDLDLKVLVAPLKTVDSVVKKIPVMGKVLGGSLVSIPMKITGNLKDPKITYLDALAMGSGLFNVMKRVFEYPVKIFSPKTESRLH